LKQLAAFSNETYNGLTRRQAMADNRQSPDSRETRRPYDGTVGELDGSSSTRTAHPEQDGSVGTGTVFNVGLALA